MPFYTKKTHASIQKTAFILKKLTAHWWPCEICTTQSSKWWDWARNWRKRGSTARQSTLRSSSRWLASGWSRRDSASSRWTWRSRDRPGRGRGSLCSAHCDRWPHPVPGGNGLTSGTRHSPWRDRVDLCRSWCGGGSVLAKGQRKNTFFTYRSTQPSNMAFLGIIKICVNRFFDDKKNNTLWWHFMFTLGPDEFQSLR